MDFSGLMAQIGFDAVHWTAIGVGAVFLLCSLVACALAFSAAGSARRARDEMTVLAMESRTMLNESRAALDAFNQEAQRRREQSGFAGSEDHSLADSEDRDTEAETTALENAKTAATVPAALLGRAFRRRS